MASTVARPYRVVLAALAAVLCVGVVIATAKALVVLFGGALFAVALHAVSAALARVLRLPYLLCFAAVVCALLATGITMTVVAGPSLLAQLGELVRILPDALHHASTTLRHSPVSRVIDAPAAISTSGATWLSRAVTAVGTSLEVLGGLAVIFFVGVYGAAQPSEYTRALLAVVPARHRASALRAARAVDHDLGRWLLGRFVAMAFVGVSCAIAFTLLHLPLAMTLAVVAGVFTFVPYVGAILSGIPPTLLAFTHDTTSAVIVLLVFTGLHFVEGYILSPLLARVTVHFPPALTLAGQIVLASLLGPVGLVFSTPLLVVAVSTLQTLRARSPRMPRRWS